MGLSAYLQRKDTIAFGGRPNQLVTLIVRKILGSSTFAVAQTLAKIIERLNRIELPTLDDLADLDTAEEDAEEWDGEDADDEADAPIDPEKLKAEIEELTGYRDLAFASPLTPRARTYRQAAGDAGADCRARR